MELVGAIGSVTTSNRGYSRVRLLMLLSLLWVPLSSSTVWPRRPRQRTRLGLLLFASPPPPVAMRPLFRLLPPLLLLLLIPFPRPLLQRLRKLHRDLVTRHEHPDDELGIVDETFVRLCHGHHRLQHVSSSGCTDNTHFPEHQFKVFQEDESRPISVERAQLLHHLVARDRAVLCERGPAVQLLIRRRLFPPSPASLDLRHREAPPGGIARRRLLCRAPPTSHAVGGGIRGTRDAGRGLALTHAELGLCGLALKHEHPLCLLAELLGLDPFLVAQDAVLLHRRPQVMAFRGVVVPHALVWSIPTAHQRNGCRRRRHDAALRGLPLARLQCLLLKLKGMLRLVFDVPLQFLLLPLQLRRRIV